ncbi:hypothetical protein HDU97_001614 [Phlyctochytrium planicorne]|nr:hypothetical protein HDU97_001614 [Phlyctochytrium planicorne]
MRIWPFAAGLALLCATGAVWSQPLPQKTNVIKIGVLLPFSANYDPSSEESVLSSFINSLNSVMVYNGLLYYVNKTNNDPTILPDTRIEVVPMNSKLDRGVSLTGALKLIDQSNVTAIIGESNSRNTVTMAVAAAVNNVLHCANLATTPQLSNKVYFTFGSGVTQQLQVNAPLYNISIASVVVFDINKSDFKEELQQLIDIQAQTILTVVAQFPAVTLMKSASQLNMLDGTYWFITSTGWTEGMFGTAAAQAVVKNITGVWQVQTPLFEDTYVLPDGSNAEAVALRTFWDNIFYSNEDPNMPGWTRTYNASAMIMPYTAATAPVQFPSNCPVGDGQTSVATTIPKFIAPKVVNNQTMYISFAGNQCTGEKNAYLEGYLSVFSMNVGYMIMKPTDYMHDTVKCGKMLVSMFDYYTKQGKITVDQINARQLPSLTKGNISQLINNVSMVDFFGNKMVVDSNGDLQMEQDIFTYKGTPVGKWWRENNTIVLNSEPFVFLGGKTAPPPTPIIPIVQFKAKTAMRYAFDAITAVCMLFTILLFGYMIAYKQMKIFMASSPNFLALILLGANISYIGVYLFSMYPMTDSSCIVFGWFKYMGFAVVFGALLVKTYRISVIFVSKKNKARKLNDSVMLLYFGAFVSIWAAILAIWTILPSQRPFLETESIANVAKNGTITHFFQTPHCNFNDYNYVNLAAMVITLAGGVWLTYSVRNTPSAFNESKWIALAIYNWVVIGIVLNAISNFAVKDPDVIFVMEALVVILTQTGVAVMLFVPKVIEIMAGRGNNNDTFMNTTSSHGTNDKPQSNFGASSMNTATSPDVKHANESAKKLPHA